MKLLVINSTGNRNVTNCKSTAVRIVGDNERGIFGAEEIRATTTAHPRQAEITRHGALWVTLVMLITDDGSHAGVETNKRSTAHWNTRRGTGHHVMVASTVIALVVADRTDDGTLVSKLGELFHLLAKMNASDRCLDSAKFTADFLRCTWLGVEHFVMSGSAVHPD